MIAGDGLKISSKNVSFRCLKEVAISKQGAQSSLNVS